MAPAGERPRSSRALWIAAAVALLVLLIWFAVRAYRAGARTAPDPRPAAGGAATAEGGRPFVA